MTHLTSPSRSAAAEEATDTSFQKCLMARGGIVCDLAVTSRRQLACRPLWQPPYSYWFVSNAHHDRAHPRVHGSETLALEAARKLHRSPPILGSRHPGSTDLNFRRTRAFIPEDHFVAVSLKVASSGERSSATTLCFSLTSRMSLKAEDAMDRWRKDKVLGEMFTDLETIVYPILKPDASSLVVQIFDINEVRNTQTETKQFRLFLSDNDNLMEAVLAPELIEEAKCNLIKKGSIIRILEYSLYAIGLELEMKRVIMVEEMEVIVANFRLVGDPISLNWTEWKEEDSDEDTWE